MAYFKLALILLLSRSLILLEYLTLAKYLYLTEILV